MVMNDLGSLFMCLLDIPTSLVNCSCLLAIFVVNVFGFDLLEFVIYSG